MKGVDDLSQQRFDISHEDEEFSVHPAGFCTCFSPGFLHYTPISPFWSSNVDSVPLYVGDRLLGFDFTGGYS